MWRLLYCHPEIMITQERYFSLVLNKKPLSKKHFEKKRFLTISQDDTYYDQKEFERIHENSESKFDNASVVGDKIPTLFYRYESIQQQLPNVKIIFLFRNIFDVAISYNRRAADTEDSRWPSNKQSANAVNEWNHALRVTKRALDSMDILPIKYERFFDNPTHLDILTDFLSVESDASFREDYRVWSFGIKQHLRSKPKDGLTSLEATHLLEHADFTTYRQLSHLYEKNAQKYS